MSNPHTSAATGATMGCFTIGCLNILPSFVFSQPLCTHTPFPFKLKLFSTTPRFGMCT